MKVRAVGRHFRSIWLAEDGWSVDIIDQRQLPHAFVVTRLATCDDVAAAIVDMAVRGAPLIGAAAAYGMCLAARADASDAGLERARARLLATRPTAVNLSWAVDEIREAVRGLEPPGRVLGAYRRAAEICDADVATCRAIGEHGARVLADLARTKHATRSSPLQVLTHCNAGWLATVDHGTALAPIYEAHARGVPVHVWVDETRPRNQGASLTAWELGEAGVPHTVIVDNAGGHLMQRGRVDAVIVGSDRTTASGDVCNKIGTYLKALAARAHDVPFFVALPSSTIDWTLEDGVKDIPIEDRDEGEVTTIAGRGPDGRVVKVSLVPEGTRAANPAFDVTPAALVTALVTERGVCAATPDGLRALFPEAKAS